MGAAKLPDGAGGVPGPPWLTLPDYEQERPPMALPRALLAPGGAPRRDPPGRNPRLAAAPTPAPIASGTDRRSRSHDQIEGGQRGAHEG